MELRLKTARTTRDMDLALKELPMPTRDWDANTSTVLEALRAVGLLDSGDFFTFVFGDAVQDLDAAPYGGARFPADSRLAGRSFVKCQCLSARLAQGVPRERLVYFNFEDERLGELEAADLGRILEESEHGGLRAPAPEDEPGVCENGPRTRSGFFVNERRWLHRTDPGGGRGWECRDI